MEFPSGNYAHGCQAICDYIDEPSGEIDWYVKREKHNNIYLRQKFISAVGLVGLLEAQHLLVMTKTIKVIMDRQLLILLVSRSAAMIDRWFLRSVHVHGGRV